MTVSPAGRNAHAWYRGKWFIYWLPDRRWNFHSSRDCCMFRFNLGRLGFGRLW